MAKITKRIFRGRVTVAELRHKSGAAWRSGVVDPGAYERASVMVAFDDSNNDRHWFYSAEVNIPPARTVSETAWLHDTYPPRSKIEIGDLIEISAAVKKADTSHGIQLYYVRMIGHTRGDATSAAAASSDGAAWQSECQQLREQIAALTARLIRLEDHTAQQR